MAITTTAVVVPIYNAPLETRRCLAALAKTKSKDSAAVIVIDDASTDPRVAPVLAQLPREWVVLRNHKNMGFVATANLGMALAGRADVVLLNSDTQVSTGWLDAMLLCAQSDPRIASVTPLTNHGEIASVPVFCQPNPWPEDPDQWARAALESGPADYPDIPTGVGFCMYMRRTAIDELGGFDEIAFGRGYGEENDWCCRATKAGWRHVLCDHAFVAHQGGASFSPLGLLPGGSAMETLLGRYPHYADLVETFIAEDPFKSRREHIVRTYNTQIEAQG
jgi:GT2 family glycosyltransferase